MNYLGKFSVSNDCHGNKENEMFMGLEEDSEIAGSGIDFLFHSVNQQLISSHFIQKVIVSSRSSLVLSE